jgi:hypothetical protein
MQRGWLLRCADHRKRNRARLSPRHSEGKSDRRKRKVKKGKIDRSKKEITYSKQQRLAKSSHINTTQLQNFKSAQKSTNLSTRSRWVVEKDGTQLICNETDSDSVNDNQELDGK